MVIRAAAWFASARSPSLRGATSEAAAFLCMDAGLRPGERTGQTRMMRAESECRLGLGTAAVAGRSAGRLGPSRQPPTQSSGL